MKDKFIKNLILTMFLVSILSTAYTEIKKQTYGEYLKEKERILLINIENKDIAGFIPLTVLFQESKQTTIIGPQANPFRFEFNPDHPQADKYGRVKYPNVDVKAHKQQLAEIQNTLKQLKN